jgi:pheromone shutdown-related protein TraB
MRYKSLILIGTSHISPESIKQVEATIRKQKPAVVAVELDRGRLAALMSGKKERLTFSDIRRIGIKGYLFALLGAWAERKLGKMVGVAPGSEMIAALRTCHELKIPVALIDQEIEITLKKFSKALSWGEKARFAWDILKTVFLRKGFEFDLRKVPSQKLIEKMTNELKKGYPNVYRVLVTERNEIMAKRLAILMNRFEEKTIVAVVGAGHEKEMIALVKNYLKPRA